ncbi:general substrate transporter [Aspergillus granulosus]|uniref:General substrate transporter n=1 Tax=Aspergillus granulosus TaxID=176169 RepID=A0ABR4GXB1_9EURO
MKNVQATNGYGGSMMNGMQTLDPWQDYFNYPTGSLLGIISVIMSLGSIAALPVVPYKADLLGRRMGILIGCAVMIFGVILQSVSANYGMFLAGRFFIGFEVAIAQGASPLLITELVHTQHRAIVTTIYNNTFYSFLLGYLSLTSVATWYVELSLLRGSHLAPTTSQTTGHGGRQLSHKPCPLYYRFSSFALKVLADCYANGDMEDEVVQLQLHEIQETIRLEEFESSSWLELVRTRGNRHRTIILISAVLFSQWSGNSLASYYIAQILDDIGYTDSVEQNLINGCLQIMNFTVALTICFFVDKIGRRKLFLVSTAGMLIAFIVWIICSARYDIAGSSAAVNAMIDMIYVYYLFYNIACSGDRGLNGKFAQRAARALMALAWILKNDNVSSIPNRPSGLRKSRKRLFKPSIDSGD